MVQIAMKTALHVFMFQIPCKLTCFINQARQLTKDEFQTFWQKINTANEFQFAVQKSDLYGGYSSAANTVAAL